MWTSSKLNWGCEDVDAKEVEASVLFISYMRSYTSSKLKLDGAGEEN